MNVASLKYEIFSQNIITYPFNWEKEFGNKRKLNIEIGFGGGEFLAYLASKNPEENYIGFETSLLSCERAQKKFFEKNLINVRIIRGDARVLIPELFKDKSVSKVYVNFPCPWPKKRHENRRIFVKNFRDTLSAILKDNSEMHLATDVDWYAEEVYENFKKDERFEVEEIIKNFDREFKTRYEKKWDDEGRNKYLLKIKKVNYSPIERYFIGEDNMPHKKIKKINIKKIEEISDNIFEEDMKKVIIRESYCDNKNNKYLIKTLASDNNYTQEFFVTVTKREDEWLIKLDSMTSPYRTPSVKYAIETIAKYLGE